jgi:hypothetical protein
MKNPQGWLIYILAIYEEAQNSLPVQRVYEAPIVDWMSLPESGRESPAMRSFILGDTYAKRLGRSSTGPNSCHSSRSPR